MIDLLKARLDEISRISPTDWRSSLTSRERAELEFHNKHRQGTVEAQARSQDTFEKFFGNKKYYAATRRSTEYLYSWIKRHAPGAIVLDYACGNGNLARLSAHAGAALAIGLDISDVSIANARVLAEQEGVSGNTYFVQANAEDTKLPAESVDYVLCSGMLHHLDLSYAFPELRRLLKVGGKILAVESLDYNPAIKLYRKMTPDMRTDWEKAHILDHSDLRFARRFFDVGEVRYWHVVGYVGGRFPGMLPALDKIDQILEKIPLLQLMAWIWSFELVRPSKE